MPKRFSNICFLAIVNKVSLLLIFIGLTIGTKAQELGISYLDFSLQNSSNTVLVSWVVSSGNTCQDVEVWRGRDSLNLDYQYTYPGICGDNDSDKVYSYTDIPPTAGVIYYYQVKVITDRTEIKKVLVPPELGLSVYPNPASDKLQLVFNVQSKLNSFQIFNSQGQEVLKVDAPDNALELDISDLPSGSYFYQAVFKDADQIESFIID